MVSWSDGDESPPPSSLGTAGPNSMYDSEYCGLAEEVDKSIRCHCNAVPQKLVAFEGCWTGRRFLACAGMLGETYDFVHWVDDVWPDQLCNSLSKLWEMYAEMKDANVRNALDTVERKWKFQDEIGKLHTDLTNVQDELKKEVEEKQVTPALKAKAEQALVEARSELEAKKRLDASTSNMHKFLRQKAERDIVVLKEEKRKLESMIGDLQKQKSGLRAKILKIKQICEE